MSPRVLRGTKATRPVLLHPEKAEGFDPNGWVTSVAPARGEVAVRLAEGTESALSHWSTWLVGSVETVQRDLERLGRGELVESIRARVA